MIGKKRNGSYPVYVYNPRTKKKAYVGSRPKLDEARELERVKTAEFKRRKFTRETCRSFADRWLDEYHGEGTKRPAPTTLAQHRGQLKSFLADFGDRYLSDIARKEALRWARHHPHAAKVVSAMFNDAVDEEELDTNPFANRRQEQSRGRQDITPLTEDEVDRLAEIALEQHPGYGRVVRAWILFAAWVGARPGEYFALDWADLDLDAGSVRVTRVKGKRQTHTIVVPQIACQAIRDMNTIRRGLVFPSPRGLPMVRGASRYYWDPVRVTFAAELSRERWRELFEHRKPEQRDIDLYELRHFCGSIMADRGASAAEIAQQLGNSEEVCRRNYIHVYEDRVLARNRAVLDHVPASLSAARQRKIGGTN